MKKKWFGLRMCLGICAALGWWGLLYPELTLNPGTVKVISLSEDGESLVPCENWDDPSSLYWDLLNAGSDKITYRSRLFMELNLIWEAFHDGNK